MVRGMAIGMRSTDARSLRPALRLCVEILVLCHWPARLRGFSRHYNVRRSKAMAAGLWVEAAWNDVSFWLRAELRRAPPKPACIGYLPLDLDHHLPQAAPGIFGVDSW
jgi:hypothetical protein